MMNNKERRVGMPKKRAILEYWQYNHTLLGHTKNGEEWGVEENECFACGNFLRGLHRAHINPLILGGSNSADNIHLLCPSCHAESEGINNYWNWIKYKRFNEWKYPQEHLFLWIKMQGIDIIKEGQYLDTIMANEQQIEEHIKNIFDRCGITKISGLCSDSNEYRNENEA